MKRIYLLMALLSVTIANCEDKKPLLYDDVYRDKIDESTQYPLVCLADSEFSNGTELILRVSKTEYIHAVFPDKLKAPQDFSKRFSLKGVFRGLAKKSTNGLVVKVPEYKNYQYFLVTSWKIKS